ncbi:RIF1 Telomere length regulator protein RIF1 [Candida maltosa Xu316]|uniref:Telomere-associated protein Rif1 N-terminal domain-containing protein n=1 Tax=Candida maltosa (strain Xu316) TaxID=1245528 RepID=M3HK95_CANMX|nr:hypothetical protein G210_1741 [Candida maltosa Xu316]
MAQTRQKSLKGTKMPSLTRKRSSRRRSTPKKLQESQNNNNNSNNNISSQDSAVASPKESSVSLNSSPIKPRVNIDRSSNNSSPIRGPSLLSSSPTKKMKSVAFSDDLISDIPSTPDRSQSQNRSILKACDVNLYTGLVDPNNTSLWEKESGKRSYGPGNNSFWLQGTIVQLSPNSPELASLIEGCVAVLSDESFDKRFEVYATLNNIYKTNTSANVVKLFTTSRGEPIERQVTPSPKKTTNNSQSKKVRGENSYVSLLAAQIVEDIKVTEDALFERMQEKENESPSKNDPFRIRVINQALKLMSYFLLDQELNKYLTVECISWIYNRACTMLTHPKVSKVIVSSYLVIMKDCKLGPKKRKALFDNVELTEKMLFSLINMKRFPSSSLVSEQFMCFKNFVHIFPSIMAKNIAQWFGMLLLNICEIGSPFYLKCFTVGVHCLLEVTKAFLDNRNVALYVKQFLSSRVPPDIKSMSSTDSIAIDSQLSDSDDSKVIDIVLAKLQELIKDSQFKAAMDIWVAITVLVGNGNFAFEKWEHLNKWLQITKLCFNSQNPEARILALSCWKAVCYNLCRNDLDAIRKILDPIMNQTNLKDKSTLINTAMKPKVKLFTYLFNSFNASEMDKEIIDTMHNLFIAILYSTVNPIVIKQRTKYLHVLWDKVFQLIFANFYFKKNSSNPYMNQLGLQLLMKFLKPSSPINEKNFNEVRCLSNDPVSISELNSLPSRWIHAKFDRIMQNMVFVFSSKSISVEDKVGFLVAFLVSLQPVVKNETTPSTTTCDIVDNLPFVLTQLVENTSLTHTLAIKIIVNLHDTFTSAMLMRKPEDSTSISPDNNIYTSILSNCFKNLAKDETLEVFNLIIESLPPKKTLVFVADYLKSCPLTDEVQSMMIDMLDKRAVETNKRELLLYGEICQYFGTGFDSFVKKMIQAVVVISDSEEMLKCLEYLNISSWNVSAMLFFLMLVKNAPNKYISQFTVDLLKKMLKDKFIFTLEFLTVQDFEAEITPLVDFIFQTSLEFVGEPLFKICSVLKNYLTFKLANSENYELIDGLLVGCYSNLGIDVGPLITDMSKFPRLQTELDGRNLTLEDGKIVDKVPVVVSQDAQVRDVDSFPVSRIAINSALNSLSPPKILSELPISKQEVEVIDLEEEKENPDNDQLSEKNRNDVVDNDGKTGEKSKYFGTKKEPVVELQEDNEVIESESQKEPIEVQELPVEEVPVEELPVEELPAEVFPDDDSIEETPSSEEVMPARRKRSCNGRFAPSKKVKLDETIEPEQKMIAESAVNDEPELPKTSEDEPVANDNANEKLDNESHENVTAIDEVDENQSVTIVVTEEVQSEKVESEKAESPVPVENTSSSLALESIPVDNIIKPTKPDLQLDPMTLISMLNDKSDEELSSLTAEERYNMETKLLNFMIRLRK